MRRTIAFFIVILFVLGLSAGPKTRAEYRSQKFVLCKWHACNNPDLSVKIRLSLLEGKVPSGYEIHHIIPLGILPDIPGLGFNNPLNTIILTEQAHRGKGNSGKNHSKDLATILVNIEKFSLFPEQKIYLQNLLTQTMEDKILFRLIFDWEELALEYFLEKEERGFLEPSREFYFIEDLRRHFRSCSIADFERYFSSPEHFLNYLESYLTYIKIRTYEAFEGRGEATSRENKWREKKKPFFRINDMFKHVK